MRYKNKKWKSKNFNEESKESALLLLVGISVQLFVSITSNSSQVDSECSVQFQSSPRSKPLYESRSSLLVDRKCADLCTSCVVINVKRSTRLCTCVKESWSNYKCCCSAWESFLAFCVVCCGSCAFRDTYPIFLIA